MTMGKKSPKTLLPCASCPWRVHRDSSTIPGYNHANAINLLSTIGDDDGLRPIMACHGSTDDDMRACKGYLAREGWRNINVRILLVMGQIANPSAVLKACEGRGVELEPDYHAVLRKLARGIPERDCGTAP
ncbi:MAG: DUF6283 family protein [Labedaea sp.]